MPPKLNVPLSVLLFTQALFSPIHRPLAPCRLTLADVTEALKPQMRITGSALFVPVKVPPLIVTLLSCPNRSASYELTKNWTFPLPVAVQLLKVLYWLKLPKLLMPALPVPVPVAAPLLVTTQSLKVLWEE